MLNTTEKIIKHKTGLLNRKRCEQPTLLIGA